MSKAQRRRSQCSVMLERLSDGGRHSTVELNVLGVGRPNSRSSELHERHGYTIVCHFVRGAEGAQAYQYQLAGVPAEPAAIEATISPEARRALAAFRSHETPTEAPLSTPLGSGHDPSEEAPPLETSTRSAAAPDLPAQQQLQLDEVVGIENELQALRSLGALTSDEIDRLDELEARHDQLDRSAA